MPLQSSRCGSVARPPPAVSSGTCRLSEESSLRAELALIFARLFELGLEEGSGFDLLAKELSLAEHQQELLARNRDIAVDLAHEVDGLVSAANASVRDATRASTRAILAGRILLLAISAVSIGGALLIAWLYVGRVLLNRLQRLSDRMRRMAGGDLEAQVEIVGRDEVADMAAAPAPWAARSRRHPPWAPSCAASGGATSASWTG